MSAIEEMVELHRELVEVGKEHNASYDSFIEDDSNWILDEGDIYQPKTASIATKYGVICKLCNDQVYAIAKSHRAISKFASDYEDQSPKRDMKTENKIASFFTEFGD